MNPKIIFALFIFLFCPVLALGDFSELCKKAGGSVRDDLCVCPDGKSIDPSVRNCMTSETDACLSAASAAQAAVAGPSSPLAPPSKKCKLDPLPSEDSQQKRRLRSAPPLEEPFTQERSCTLGEKTYRFTLTQTPYPGITFTKVKSREDKLTPCFLLKSEQDKGELILINFRPDCFDPRPPDKVTGGGGCLLNLAIELASQSNLEKLTLVDASKMTCPGHGYPEFSLSKAMILTTGHTWYEGYGFKPSTADNARKYAKLKERVSTLTADRLQSLLPQIPFSEFPTVQEALSDRWKNHCAEFAKELTILWNSIPRVDEEPNESPASWTRSMR